MADVKFSDFASGGDVKVGDIVVGLRGANNAQFTFPGSGIKDSSGNYMLKYATAGAASVNYITLTSANIGLNPSITTAGTDTDIGLTLNPKGSGQIKLDQLTWPLGLGTVNYVLTTDGVSGTSWTNLGSIGVSSVTGTANEVLASPTTGAVIVGLPDSVRIATSLLDSNALTVLGITSTGTAVNYLQLANAATGGNPKWTSTGTDSNIGMDFQVKGTGIYNLFSTASGPTAVRFYEATGTGVNYVSLQAASSLAANYTVELPSASGTLALTSAIPSLPLSMANGGTGKALTPIAGAIVWTDVDSMEISAAGSSGQALLSGGAGAPTWSTATFPASAGAAGTVLRSNGTNWVASTSTFADTYAINTFLYAGSANTVTGLATAAQSVLTTGTGAAAPAWVSMATDGKLLIGSTAGAPAAATLTAGAGIAITNGSNSITISSTGGLTWSEIAGTTQSAAVDNGYVVGNAGATTITLPGTYAIGDTIAIQGKGAGGWILTAAGGDTIQLGSSVTSSGGSLTSANQWDSVEVVCVTANSVWSVMRVLSTGLTIT